MQRHQPHPPGVEVTRDRAGVPAVDGGVAQTLDSPAKEGMSLSQDAQAVLPHPSHGGLPCPTHHVGPRPHQAGVVVDGERDVETIGEQQRSGTGDINKVCHGIEHRYAGTVDGIAAHGLWVGDPLEDWPQRQIVLGGFMVLHVIIKQPRRLIRRSHALRCLQQVDGSKAHRLSAEGPEPPDPGDPLALPLADRCVVEQCLVG